MDDLPDDVLSAIYANIGRQGFRHLAPLLLLRKHHTNVIFSAAVLKQVCLVEFLRRPTLIEEWSLYHIFFKKCVLARNLDATYLESIRIAFQSGAIEHSVGLLFETIPEPNYATFARGLFLIFCNFVREGIFTLSSLISRLGTIDRLHSVAQKVSRYMLLF